MPTRPPDGPRVLLLESDDPEAFGATAAPRHPSRLLLRGRGRFAGWRARTTLGDAIVNQGEVALPVTFHNAVGDRAVFSLTGGAGPEARIQGTTLEPGILSWWRAGTEIHTIWPAGLPWWNLIFPLPQVERAAAALLGAPLPMPRQSALFLPIGPEGRARLLDAVARLRASPEWVPDEWLADTLLAVLLELVAPQMGPPPQGGPSRLSCLRVADGLAAIGDRVREMPSLSAVCEELGVPARTLNACAARLLGMSAGAYLRSRRLQRARSDLRTGRFTVTEAAMRHGFWELGRFSTQYRALFGELPSSTARQGPRG